LPPDHSRRNRAGLQRLALEAAADNSPDGSLLRITVSGASMEPALRSGDVILVRRSPAADLTPGDLVTFLADSGPVTHRIVLLGPGDLITTKGDHSRHLDAPIRAAQIVGLVVARVRDDITREIAPGRRAAWTARLSLLEGRFAGRIGPARSGSRWFKLVNLPIRLLVSLSARTGLSR
jgi:hypothetical protein